MLKPARREGLGLVPDSRRAGGRRALSSSPAFLAFWYEFLMSKRCSPVQSPQAAAGHGAGRGTLAALPSGVHCTLARARSVRAHGTYKVELPSRILLIVLVRVHTDLVILL